MEVIGINPSSEYDNYDYIFCSSSVVDLQSLIMLVDCGKNDDDGSFLSENKHGDRYPIHDPCCLD